MRDDLGFRAGAGGSDGPRRGDAPSADTLPSPLLAGPSDRTPTARRVQTASLAGGSGRLAIIEVIKRQFACPNHALAGSAFSGPLDPRELRACFCAVNLWWARTSRFGRVRWNAIDVRMGIPGLRWSLLLLLTSQVVTAGGCSSGKSGGDGAAGGGG